MWHGNARGKQLTMVSGSRKITHSMAVASQENQLELFDLQRQPLPRPQRETLGRFLLQLRYDQLILSGMAGLIGLTVVFACGVERGKQLVRFERAMLVRQERPQPPPQRSTTSAVTPSSDDTPPEPLAPAMTKPKPSSAPAVTPRMKQATKLASESTPSPSKVRASRYAVQVVTYSRPHLAKQELDRLRARGEPAFLVIRDGRTVVYVGPFPSRGNASEKVAMLKAKYQDCFVRSL